MSEVDNKIKIIVEGLLLAAGRPLNLDSIALVFNEEERPDKNELKTVMSSISDDCKDRGFELQEVASGYRFQVRQELSEWVAKLWEERAPRYTQALLETLSLIAYRQPITRGDIEEIRGVGVSSTIIRTLLDREWIRVVGHRDVPGKPAMFATTRQFLDYFNLKSLQELPTLAEIKDLIKGNQELDLNEDMAQQRVLELPDDLLGESDEQSNEVAAEELLSEQEALALASKPLDEILSFGLDDKALEDESGDELTEAEETLDDSKDALDELQESNESLKDECVETQADLGQELEADAELDAELEENLDAADADRTL